MSWMAEMTAATKAAAPGQLVFGATGAGPALLPRAGMPS